MFNNLPLRLIRQCRKRALELETLSQTKVQYMILRGGTTSRCLPFFLRSERYIKLRYLTKRVLENPFKNGVCLRLRCYRTSMM